MRPGWYESLDSQRASAARWQDGMSNEPHRACPQATCSEVRSREKRLCAESIAPALRVGIWVRKEEVRNSGAGGSLSIHQMWSLLKCSSTGNIFFGLLLPVPFYSSTVSFFPIRFDALVRHFVDQGWENFLNGGPQWVLKFDTGARAGANGCVLTTHLKGGNNVFWLMYKTCCNAISALQNRCCSMVFSSPFKWWKIDGMQLSTDLLTIFKFLSFSGWNWKFHVPQMAHGL